MNSAALVARILLVLVFAVAGSSKLLELEQTRVTVEAFGVRRTLARAIGTGLPFAELLTAIALLPQATARGGAVAALALLLAFICGIAYALAHGNTPDCNCFGQLSSEAIGWRTLARNGLLAAVAIFAIAEAPGSSLSSWTTSSRAAALVASVAVLAAALLLLEALRLRATVNEQRDSLAAAKAGLPVGPAPGLPVGTPAPDFDLPDLVGGTVGLESLRAGGRATVLVFASPTCGPCTALMPDLARWSSVLHESLNIAVVESGVFDPGALAPPDGLTVIHEEERELAERYLISATPTALLVDVDGRIASPPALGAMSIENLIRVTLRSRPAAANASPQMA